MSNKPSRPTISLPNRDDVVLPVEPENLRPVRLKAPFGFVNEYDAVYLKQGGTLITNPIEIAVLKERGAPLEDA